jgi:hypothetical protein
MFVILVSLSAIFLPKSRAPQCNSQTLCNRTHFYFRNSTITTIGEVGCESTLCTCWHNKEADNEKEIRQQ